MSFLLVINFNKKNFDKTRFFFVIRKKLFFQYTSIKKSTNKTRLIEFLLNYRTY